jgi:hypothetical protein
MTAHEAQVFAIPAKIFAIDFRVVDCDIFRLPESILRVDDRIAYLDILCILEAIVAVLSVVVNTYILAVHEHIVTVAYRHIAELDVAAVPQKLFTVGKIGVFNIYTLHAAEQFGCVDLAVNHAAAARIPQTRACAFGKIAVAHSEIRDLPEHRFPLKPAVDGLDVGAFLDA